MNTLELVGSSFRGTIIEDPEIEPYFIIRSEGGGYSLNIRQVSPKGRESYKAVCYPSTFESCLKALARERLHEPGKVFSSLESYVSTWKKVTDDIVNISKKWKVAEF